MSLTARTRLETLLLVVLVVDLVLGALMLLLKGLTTTGSALFRSYLYLLFLPSDFAGRGSCSDELNMGCWLNSIVSGPTISEAIVPVSGQERPLDLASMH
jgi:hypothetical protein